MDGQIVGTVLAIALKTAEGGPMREVRDAVGIVDGGLEGSVKPSPDRGITFLSSRQWTLVQRELSGGMPWHTRRANVLIDADSLGALIGRIVQVGELLVEIKGETRPCGLMDKLQPGLRVALTPDHRAGVHGRVLRGGTLRVGDTMRLQAG
ncbi:MAG: MOSC domain-containing protein [Phycisphaerae bacterium]|jgi:MOSC domain-containing protein YiiM